MTIEEIGKQYHDRGYNCCQSVLCTLMDETGLDEKLSAQLGTCFGGGMRCGNVCGAVTGGLMAIGCACMDGANPASEKAPSTELAHELENRFSEKMGTLLCSEILAAHERSMCLHCIGLAAEITKEIIQKNKK